MKPLCIYHGNCADGFTAAWVVWKRFGDSFDYHAATYQDAPPDVAGRQVVIVDFSYKRPVLLDLAKRAAGVLVLDHHKSAAEDLAGDGDAIMQIHPAMYGPAVNWSEILFTWSEDIAAGRNRIYTVFDMNRSGAGLAWDFFHDHSARPMLVDYVEDRDLWRFALQNSRDVSAYVFSHAYTFENWDMIEAELRDNFGGVAKAGAAIERKHHKDVAELVDKLRTEMIIGGRWVPAANLPYTYTSDAGHLMCAPYPSPQLQGEIVTPPFAACWWDTPEGRVFSLRSREGGADVSSIAKVYGGGGHANAAGFRLPHGVTP